MAGYLDIDLTVDPDELTDRILDGLADRGFAVTGEGDPSAALSEVVALEFARQNDGIRQAGEEVYRTFGKTVVGLPAIDDTPATIETTWTVIDAAGYTIPAGTRVVYQVSSAEMIGFELPDELVIPAGQVQAAGVGLVALEAGTGGNGVPAGPLQLYDSIAHVTSVVATTVSSGGVDAETDRSYVNRLSDDLAVPRRPTREEDFAVFARRVAGVHRARGIANYNPADQTFGNEKMVAVAVVGANGEALSAAVKTDVETLLEEQREANFIAHVIDPSYTQITVVFEAVAQTGYAVADVEARAEQAVLDYLDPANWAGGADDPPEWRDENRVRYLELAQVINAVDGVDYVTALTVNGGQVDVVMVGVAPLPRPSDDLVSPTTADGTVTAP